MSNLEFLPQDKSHVDVLNIIVSEANYTNMSRSSSEKTNENPSHIITLLGVKLNNRLLDISFHAYYDANTVTTEFVRVENIQVSISSEQP